MSNGEWIVGMVIFWGGLFAVNTAFSANVGVGALALMVWGSVLAAFFEATR